MVNQTNSTREIVERFSALLEAGDIDGIVDICAEDIDWLVSSSSGLPSTGNRLHRSELAYILKMMLADYWRGRGSANARHIIIEDTEAIALGLFEQTVISNGRGYTTQTTIHMTVENGAITRLHIFESTRITARMSSGFSRTVSSAIRASGGRCKRP